MSKPYRPNIEVLDAKAFPEGMGRVALGIEYDGSNLHGFQAQKSGVPTVGKALEYALSRVSDEPIRVVCAGRTDAGVHATGQVVHFDTKAIRSEKAWLRGANRYLPDDISIRWSQAVPSAFHARYSAKKRTYRYIIHTHKTPSALLRHRVTWSRAPLSASAMNEAAQWLVGEHDFSAYRASQCQAKNPVRTIDNISVVEKNDFIIVEITANAFLYHMVRNMMGVLMSIASGDRPISWSQEVLLSADRTQGGKTASAAGLYLVNVSYDRRFELPRLDWGPSIVSGML